MFSRRIAVRTNPPTATRLLMASQILTRRRRETATPAVSLVVHRHMPNSNICMKMIQPHKIFRPHSLLQMEKKDKMKLIKVTCNKSYKFLACSSWSDGD